MWHLSIREHLEKKVHVHFRKKVHELSQQFFLQKQSMFLGKVLFTSTNN